MNSLPERMYVHGVHDLCLYRSEVTRSLELELKTACPERPWEHQKLNPGPLQEQQGLFMPSHHSRWLAMAFNFLHNVIVIHKQSKW